MKKSFWSSALGGLGLLLLTSNALAHQEDAPEEPTRGRAPTYDPSDYRSDQTFAFELRLGPYRPDIDSEFNGGATPFRDMFGTGESIFIGVEIDWQALRIPYLGTLGPGLGWGIVRYGGNARFASDGGESKQPTSIWIMPMYAVAVLRADVFAQEFGIPIVPYGKLGVNWAMWEAGDAGSVSSVGDVAGQGLEYGYQFQLGAMLHLNFFAPQAALDLDNTSGVNNAYLYLEWLKSDADSFGKGLQTGTSTWMTGLALEY